ncbi:MAG: hypothetical protein R2715_05965 [Ilumatobacteraceae bacterium]
MRSVLGRYLEHSRIYVFANGNGPGQPLYLIGSADMMARNLDHRVEALVPIEHPAHQARIDSLLSAMWRSDVAAWELGADTIWRRVGGENAIDAQQLVQIIPRSDAPRSLNR